MGRARKYNKKIQLWQTAPIVNEWGGNTVSETLLTTTWCEIKTPNTTYRSTEFGITDTTDTIVLRLRKRNDLTYNSENQFFKYRGKRYIIESEPINIGFEDREIQITLKKEMLKGVNEVPPIGGNAFPYTFNFQLA